MTPDVSAVGVGNFLRGARGLRGLTTREAASAYRKDIGAECAHTQVVRNERGQRVVGLEEFFNWCLVYDVSVGAWFEAGAISPIDVPQSLRRAAQS